MRNEQFFMVWCVGGNAPTCKHGDRRSAESEARRLASLHRGKSFVVLQSVCELVANDVTKIDHAPEVPF